jgi:hypothetical protein
MNTKIETLNDLTAEYARLSAECAEKYDVKLGSADEHQTDTRLPFTVRARLAEFVDRWDAALSAENAGRRTKELLEQAPVLALLQALELGYRARDRGLSIDQARTKLFTGEVLP